MNDATQENAGAKPKTKEKGIEEIVTLFDGRIVTFVGKRKMLKESLVNDEGKTAVRLDFRNGETRLFVLPDSLLQKFAAHGAEQKLGDETAGVDDVDDMVLGVDELIERLNKGEWSIAREGSGVSGTSVLLRALVEVSSKTVEQVKAFLKDMSAKEKTALRNSPQIKPVVDRIEAEKVAKIGAVDTAGLLSKLESIGS